jgi:AAA15 family ATPase/GTPase
MLSRFVVKNLYSFKEQTEFNLFPGRATRLGHHRYKKNEIEVLKLSALYGANGSGKSNLIKSIALLKEIVLSGRIPAVVDSLRFKLDAANQKEPAELGIEFFCNTAFYYYSIAIKDNTIVEEYLGEVKGKGKEDILLFHRSIDEKRPSVKFFEGFTDSKENSLLADVITKDLLKPQLLLLTLLRGISNDAFNEMRYIHDWFIDGLQVIFPTTSAFYMAHELDINPTFRAFANELMCSYHTGIMELRVEKRPIEDFLGKDNPERLEEIKAKVAQPGDLVTLRANSVEGADVVVVNEDGKIIAKQLVFLHRDIQGSPVVFSYREESDGTRRLLEYLPALSWLLSGKPGVTFMVDEIERSIHPLMIKEILEKFSADPNTTGQLIFSTHDTNLLDQEIFRTDEIWFAEKDLSGASKLYPLSDFREHNTIDIRKGYMNGRYGAIPFLGSLEALNWNKKQDA